MIIASQLLPAKLWANILKLQWIHIFIFIMLLLYKSLHTSSEHVRIQSTHCFRGYIVLALHFLHNYIVMMYLSYLHTNQQRKFKFSLGIGLEMGAVGGWDGRNFWRLITKLNSLHSMSTVWQKLHPITQHLKAHNYTNRRH